MHTSIVFFCGVSTPQFEKKTFIRLLKCHEKYKTLLNLIRKSLYEGNSKVDIFMLPAYPKCTWKPLFLNCNPSYVYYSIY